MRSATTSTRHAYHTVHDFWKIERSPNIDFSFEISKFRILNIAEPSPGLRLVYEKLSETYIISISNSSEWYTAVGWDFEGVPYDLQTLEQS